MNTLPLLSVYDVYCGGLNNQHRAFQSTPYSGTYTSLIDTGVTSPGLAAHFYRSDRRQHGSMTFSEQAAGRISMRLAKSHYVPVGDHHYVQAPAATRGFPHGLIPGVHAATRHYIDALEEARGLTGRSDAAATEGLFSLPFGPWTQALRPDVESTADSTLRHGFRVPEQLSVSTGRSFIPDSTAEDEAILTEPLFRRPCIASVGDNPWATAYEHMEGFFNACNTLSVIARRLPRRVGHGAVHSLWFCMDAFHGHSNAFDSTPELQLAADACVILMGALYPATWEINLPMVPRGYAQAASRLARRVAEGHGCVPITQLGLEQHDLAECQRRWAAFRRSSPAASAAVHGASRCAWHDGVAPLLEMLAQNDGSHFVSMSFRSGVRSAIERAVRAAWLVHSPDGETPPPEPCPAHQCASPEDVRRPTVDPIFVASDDLEVPARGALVGIKPHQLRQLYALLLGAHLPDVSVQVVRNEGARREFCLGRPRACLLTTRRLPVRRRSFVARQLGRGHSRGRRLDAVGQERVGDADRERLSGVRLAPGQAHGLRHAARRVGQQRAAACAAHRARGAAAAALHPLARRVRRRQLCARARPSGDWRGRHARDRPARSRQPQEHGAFCLNAGRAVWWVFVAS